jgi:hypothetical protein
VIGWNFFRDSSANQSGALYKLFALRLFCAASFGKVDEQMLVSSNDDFKIWLGGFISPTGTVRVPGTPFDKAMAARDRMLTISYQLCHQIHLITCCMQQIALL